MTTASASAWTISTLFNNSGTVNVQSGTLSFSKNYNQTAGTTVISTGATLASTPEDAAALGAKVAPGIAAAQQDLQRARLIQIQMPDAIYLPEAAAAQPGIDAKPLPDHESRLQLVH